MDTMVKKMLIDATHAEETRVVVVDGNKVEEFDFESENKRQLAGNIYLAKVTRVEPSLQAAFVDYGGNRHGFLAFSEIHPDYYQIPVADREALMEEERAYAQSLSDDEDEEPAKKTRSRRGRSRGRSSGKGQNTAPAEIGADATGMETIDFDAETTDVDAQSDLTVSIDEPAVSEMSDTPVTEVATAQPDAPQDTVSSGDDTPSDDDTPPTTMAAEVDSDDPEVSSDISEHDVTTADDADDTDADTDNGTDNATDDDADADDAALQDDGIESVADDDDAMDLRPSRSPRPRRYKIQEVIKVRQIMLVQVVKEERGNKGAALTTYLSLAGRYCVLMPNSNRGGGVSRKINNPADRKRLKSVVSELDIADGMAVIVRTAGSKRTKTEIKRDYSYLTKLWNDISSNTMKSEAPSLIHEECSLVKRAIRDIYTSDI